MPFNRKTLPYPFPQDAKNLHKYNKMLFLISPWASGCSLNTWFSSCFENATKMQIFCLACAEKCHDNRKSFTNPNMSFAYGGLKHDKHDKGWDTARFHAWPLIYSSTLDHLLLLGNVAHKSPARLFNLWPAWRLACFGCSRKYSSNLWSAWLKRTSCWELPTDSQDRLPFN